MNAPMNLPKLSIVEQLFALEREMSPEIEREIRRELQISREVFNGDVGAELAAWEAGTHPLHPSQKQRGC